MSERCRAPHATDFETLYCTLPEGHDGPHVATVALDGPELARWTDAPARPRPTRVINQKRTLDKDARALATLAMEVWVAVREDDREKTLLRLNELRELARHAFAMAQSWKAEP